MPNMKSTSSKIFVPISIGELIDKITILEIKQQNMSSDKQKNVRKELVNLKESIQEINLKIDNNLFSKLKSVNNKLWDIEDQIRKKENHKEFDQVFIELARSVYIQNDKRAQIKKEINLKYNSDITEEKSYQSY